MKRDRPPLDDPPPVVLRWSLAEAVLRAWRRGCISEDEVRALRDGKDCAETRRRLQKDTPE